MTTTNQITITPTPPTSIKLEPGQQGKLSFSITSLAAPDRTQDVMLAALLVSGGKEEEVNWLVVEPRQIPGMTGGKTETVTITARPTASSPRGENKIKLVAADKEQPNDVYGESAPVICEVVSSHETPPPLKKIPWRLIAAVVGGLAVVVGGALLIWKLTGDHPGRLGEPCRGGANPCDEGLLCMAETQTCLLAGGAACQEAERCASHECVSKLDVCAIPRDGACNPADKSTKPCVTGATCDPTRKLCLGSEGAPCQTDAECLAGKCTNHACASSAPPVKPGDRCTGTCPEPLQCSPTTKLCVEQLGRSCSNNNQCATGLCEQNVCSKPELLRDCTVDGICGADQKCLEFQPGIKRCQWRPGHACTSNGDCSSKWCSQGVCSRDDGRCASQSDCPPSSVCNTVRQQCLKPSGQPCTANTECNSNFCSATRCAPANLALRKPAQQSSTVFEGNAARAVDGNTDGDWSHGSVTHTESQAQAWWQVDLGAVAEIDKVVLYNRTDCCSDRLRDFDVLLSNDGSSWRLGANYVGIAPSLTKVSIRSSARYVRVRLRGTNHLSLAEVEVYTP